MGLSIVYVYVYILMWTFFWLCWVFLAACGLTLDEMNGGYSLVVVLRLFIMVASLAMECRRALSAQVLVVVACWLQSSGSVAVVHGLRCSTACGIFMDRGLNPCPLH